MTDKPDQAPPQAKQSHPSRGRPRDAADAAMQDQPTVTPPLNAGPGRTRILDPDQATLDENLRRLYGMAAIQATLKETAAHLNVSLDTLNDFFRRYPMAKEKWDDTRHAGTMSIRVQLFKNLSTDPETARWMAERVVGIQDPYKLRDIDLRERAFAQQQKEFEQSSELKKQELAQREREVFMKEQELALKVKDLGPGPPIDIESLSMKQLLQLISRIKSIQAMYAAEHGLSYGDLKSLS